MKVRAHIKRPAVLVLIGALLVIVRPVSAEEPLSEVEIEADRVEIQRGEGRAEFTGQVRVRHRQVELECQRLVATIGDDGALAAIVATGGVRLRAAGLRATAGSARYDPSSGRVVLSGEPVVHSSGGELSGRSIVVLLEEGRVHVEGARGVFRVR